MGFFDKLKQGIKVVTGGVAKVAIAWEPTVITSGQLLTVKVSVQSTGAEVKSKGVFVDFRGAETVVAPPKPKEEQAAETPGPDGDLADADKEALEASEAETEDEEICSETLTLCGPFVLGPNESKVIEGSVQMPDGLGPTSDEELGCRYEIRGRLEAIGTDPSSGYKSIRVAPAAKPQPEACEYAV